MIIQHPLEITNNKYDRILLIINMIIQYPLWITNNKYDYSRLDISYDQ